MKFSPKPKIRTIHEEQWIPIPLEDVFGFFSNAQNLSKVTPPSVGFRILTPTPIEMKRGLRLDYQISLRGIPLKWSSEITEWNPPHHFTDLQLTGPYALWKHRHSFKALNGGTLVTDDVQYAVPLSWIPGAALVELLFVEPELRRIFLHRKKALRAHFGLPSEDESSQRP